MNSELFRVDALTASQGEAMIALFQRHFDGVTREQFHRDLDQKGWAILLEDTNGLHGFTTLDIYDVEYHGETVSVVLSGETIVDDSARGSMALPSGWIGSVNYLRRELGKGRLWWLLPVSGYRTYRFLPVFWQSFAPCADIETSPDVQDLLATLAEDEFGAQFDRAEGIVRRDQATILRKELRGIPEPRMRDRHVAFFAEKNPGHERGDELVCLTELSYENLTAAGRRMWDAGERMFAGEAAS